MRKHDKMTGINPHKMEIPCGKHRTNITNRCKITFEKYFLLFISYRKLHENGATLWY